MPWQSTCPRYWKTSKKFRSVSEREKTKFRTNICEKRTIAKLTQKEYIMQKSLWVVSHVLFFISDNIFQKNIISAEINFVRWKFVNTIQLYDFNYTQWNVSFCNRQILQNISKNSTSRTIDANNFSFHQKLCGLNARQTLGTPIHSKLEMPYTISCECSLEYFHRKSAEKSEYLAFLCKKENLECKRVLHSI